MFADFKHMIASTVSKYAPRLLYYAADHTVRKPFRLNMAAGHIDIVHRPSRNAVRIGMKHAIYLADIIDCFDYYHSSVSAKPAALGQGALVDFSVADFHAVNGFDDFEIQFAGLPEPMVTTRQYLEFADLKQGDAVIDLGSYSALTSIAFAKAVGASGRVVALEPDPVSFATARTNVDSYERATGLKTIELVQAAAAAKTGTLRLSSEGTLGSAAASLVGGHRGAIVEVEAITLDDLAIRHQLTRVDFIKIDIEGSEEELIASSGAFLARFRPKLIIEPHFVRGVSSEAALRRLLEGYGYACDAVSQTGIAALPLLTATPGSV